MDSQKPLFILGNPRSGTSLFRLMLTSHSMICIPPECGFIQWWYDKYKDWSQTNCENIDIVSSYIEDLKSSKKIETWKLNFLELKNQILNEKPDSYSALCLLVIKQYSLNHNNSALYLGDKNNYYISHLDILLKLFPKAKFILIVRDGRDVACSYKMMESVSDDLKYKPKLSTEITEIAQEWIENNNTVLEFFKSLDKSNNYIIKYENLLLNSKNELSSVCDFLNIDYEDNMLEYSSLNKKHNLEPIETMAWKQKTLSKPDSSNIGKYKQILSNDEIIEFNNISKPLLKQFDYEY